MLLQFDQCLMVGPERPIYSTIRKRQFLQQCKSYYVLGLGNFGSGCFLQWLLTIVAWHRSTRIYVVLLRGLAPRRPPR